MQLRIRNAAGVMMLVTGLPASAQQEAVATKVTPGVNCPPCTKVECVVVPPGEPTLLVAAIAIFTLGVIVGAVLAKMFGNQRR